MLARGWRIQSLQAEEARPEPAGPGTRRSENGPGRQARCWSGEPEPRAGITRRRRGVSLRRGAASRDLADPAAESRC
jgi:hypothetical protein